MNPPPIGPRDMIALEQQVDDVPAGCQTAQAKAYTTLLNTVNHLAHERNRFDDEANWERWRRARAERALHYAHRWVGGLLAIVTIFGIAIVVLAAMR